MNRHRLSKADLLQYALSGAVTERGLWSGAMTDEQADDLNKDIAEIERRIRLVEIAERRKGSYPLAKSAVVVKAAEELGLPVIDVKLIPLALGDI